MEASTSTESPHDADELEDRADELEIEARRLRQRARRLRREGSVLRWLDDAACRKKYGHGIGVFVSAAKRGQCEIGRAGRSPRVREDVADRYVASRGAVRREAAPEIAATNLYEIAVARVTRGAR